MFDSGGDMIQVRQTERKITFDGYIGYHDSWPSESYGLLSRSTWSGTRWKVFIVFRKDGKAIPALAEKTIFSSDNLTYTFTLRDSKWSDGTPVKAQDFEFAWKRAADPKTGSGYSYIFDTLKNGSDVTKGKKSVDELGVKAIDDKTLEVKLERPARTFLSLTSFGTYTPISEDFYKKNEKDFSLQPINCFITVLSFGKSWKTDSKRVLKKNDNYWDKDAVKLDEVTISVVKDTATVANLYDSNEIDYAVLTSEQVEA